MSDRRAMQLAVPKKNSKIGATHAVQGWREDFEEVFSHSSCISYIK
jgi:hypothetical protein